MEREESFTFFHISLVLLLSVGMVNHVIVIPLLMDVSGRDAWLSVCVTLALFVPVFWVIGAAARRMGQEKWTTWIARRYGKATAGAMAGVMVVILLSGAIVATIDMVNWTNSSYLAKTPPFMLALAFTATVFYTVMRGFRSIVIVSGILLPIVVLFGEFVMAANYAHKDYLLLFPVFEHGYGRVWKGMIYAGSGFAELILVILLQHRLGKPVRRRHLLILGLVLGGLTIGPVTGAIAAFGPVEAALQRNAAFEQWRLVRIADYVEHVDFLSIFQWISGAFVRVALALYLITELIPVKKLPLLLLLSVLLSISVILPVSDVTMLNFLRELYYPFLFAALLLLIVWIAALTGVNRPPGAQKG